MIRRPGDIDSLGMLEAVAGLPEQVAEAANASRGLCGLPDHDDVENVVVLGMGGSGMAGEVLLAVAAPFMAVPVSVVNSYTPPAFIGSGSLVFAVSFSGDTEETLEAAEEAAGAGARMVVVTGGGKLAELAAHIEAPTVHLPGGIPQPRAALGAMAIPPLMVLEDIGLFRGATQWVAEAVAQLESRRDSLIAGDGMVEEIAQRIGRTIPVIYGAQELGEVAAKRWKKQVNENAKSPAFWSVYPELCHNEVAGWGQHGDVTRQVMSVVNLRHDAEHPQVSKRYEIVREILEESVADVIDVRAQGEGDLAQLMDLVLIGDFVSLHMAYTAGVDPGPVPVLGDMKRRLRPEEEQAVR